MQIIMSEKKLMSIEEVSKILNFDKDNGLILGTYNNKIVSIPLNTKDKDFNKNVIVFGTSGSGKTSCYIKPNIIQLAKEKQSMILHDPKGELFKDNNLFLKSNGYNIKVLNLKDISNSDRWNPLDEVCDYLTAEKLASIIIENTLPKENNMFFQENEKKLLTAFILYVIHNKEEKRLEKISEIFANKNKEEIDKIFDLLDEENDCKHYYKEFNKFSNEAIQNSIIQNLNYKMEIFQNKIFRKLTETSDIDLSKPSETPCAYFCITNNNNLDFLNVLFLNFLLNKLMDYADLHDSQCVPNVYCMFDEFSNIATIPDLPKIISTSRDRGIYFQIMCQNIEAIKSLYPYDNWKEIIDCCDSKLFLGCTSILNSKFVSQLIYSNEIKSLKYEDEILIMKNQKPLMLNKFNI